MIGKWLNKKKSNRRTRQQYLRIFMQFDVDNSGSVSKNEIMKMFKACEMDIDEQQAQDLMNEIDADGGGQLEQDEFIQFLKKQDERIEFSLQECKKMYNYFLRGDEQTIGFEQIKNMFNCLGQSVLDSDISKMILMGDKNNDGRLDFPQFYKMMQQI